MTDQEATLAYIKRIERTEAQSGRKAAEDRGRSMYCSWTLGREFGETVDSYFERNPDKQAFWAWFKERYSNE